jgi:predicted permease
VDYRSIRDAVPAFSQVAAFLSAQELDLGRGAEAQRIRGRAVSQSFFPLLGVGTALGRWFLPEEDSAAGAHPVAVISHRFWHQHFGGDSTAIGRTLLVNSRLLTVVGVAEAGFTDIEVEPVQIWVTLALAPSLSLAGQPDRDWREWPYTIAVSVIGRIAGRAPRELVAEQATTALRHAAEAYPELDATPEVLLGRLVPAGHPHRSRAESLSLRLLLVTAVLLLIACANVASLMLSRAMARQRETAIRSSLGAGRRRLLRQYLTESMIVAFLGGGTGVLLAFWGSRLARQFSLPPGAGTINTMMLLLALGLTLVAGIVSGVVPAWRAARTDPADRLRQSLASGHPGRIRLQRVLTVMQVSLSAILLVGAGLFLRSLRAVYAVDPGLDTEQIVIVSVDLSKAGYGSPQRHAFYDEARARVLRIPGVEHASLSQFPLFPANRYGGFFRVPGRERLEIDRPYMEWIGPAYFETVGTEILRGRGITDGDRRGGEPVAVINESLATTLGRFGDVVGMCVVVQDQVRTGGCTRIVGVAETQRTAWLESAVDAAVYLAHAQDSAIQYWGGEHLLIRTAKDQTRVARQVRAALQSLQPDLPYVNVQPLEERIRADVLPYRLGATLFTLFAGLALGLAAVGLYGMLGYFIAERRPELGVRRALGAQTRDVVRFVIGQGMAPVIVGLVVGLAAAFTAVPLLQAMLFGVTGRDPATFALVAAFLSLVALVSSYLPARRATKVEPMITVRAE